MREAGINSWGFVAQAIRGSSAGVFPIGTQGFPVTKNLNQYIQSHWQDAASEVIYDPTNSKDFDHIIRWDLLMNSNSITVWIIPSPWHIITLHGDTTSCIEFAVWYRTLVPSHLQLKLEIHRVQDNECFFRLIL